MSPASNFTMGTSGLDIVFTCTQCKSPLIVDAAAAGMTVACQICSAQTPVPAASSAPDTATSPVDLQRQLKENESQRTEVTGHINQLGIQLHRWKLRLQTLNERKTALEAELASGPGR
jgi:transcription elongation factor Elf1